MSRNLFSASAYVLTLASVLFTSAICIAQPSPTALPPFLAKMERHELTMVVTVTQGDGSKVKAPAGLMAGVSIIAGPSKVRDYTTETNAEGEAYFPGIPSNPEVQQAIRYQAWVDYDGVRFPFQLDGVPSTGSKVEISVMKAQSGLDQLSAQYSIELFADEESMVARQIVRIYNEGNQIVNLSVLPDGGLRIPCPAGAKHPELHKENDKRMEVRGTDIIYKGAILPNTGDPTVVSFVFTVPYKDSSYEWSQTLPIAVKGFSVATPLHRQPRQIQAVPMQLSSLGQGEYSAIEQAKGRRWGVLKARTNIAAGEPLRFRVGGLPAASQLPEILLLAACGIVCVVILLAFRRDGEQVGTRRSRTHLLEERDRLVRALARMKKALERGRMRESRYNREHEAITARLVSIYRALDRMAEH